MKRRTLESFARAWMERLWRDRDLSAIDELHDASFVDHSPAGRGTDRAAYAAGIAELFAAFPDFTATTDGVVVDRRRSQVAIRWTATGTHAGAFLGVAPTGERVTFRGIEVLKVRRGKLLERWGEWDGLALLDELVAARARKICQAPAQPNTRRPRRK